MHSKQRPGEIQIYHIPPIQLSSLLHFTVCLNQLARVPQLKALELFTPILREILDKQTTVFDLCRDSCSSGLLLHLVSAPIEAQTKSQ